MTTLRSAPQRAVIEQWALVLNSQGIRCAIRSDQHDFILIVNPSDAERGANVLDSYDLENRERPAVSEAPARYRPTWIGVGMAALLVAFHVVVTGPEAGNAWYVVGSASAERILGGEWWRTVTALTLHADVPHLLANVLGCAVFATAVGLSVGPGAGAWLILLSGAIGNALTAAVHGSDHVSVGASTAVFGAVGLLSGDALISRRRLGLRGSRVWAPIVAALALFSMLGTGGERTDLLAHVFGLVSGVVLGTLYTAAVPRAPGRGADLLLLVTAFGALTLCWAIANPRP